MSLLLLGAGQGQNGSPESLFKISVLQTSNNTVIYENDSVDDVFTFLNSYTATVPITVQFNDNTIHQPSSGSLTLNTLNNGSNLVIFKSKLGSTATIDGQLINNTVVTIAKSYITWDNINIINAFTSDSDSGGTILRLTGNQSNITLKNFKLRRGFVGIRGTTNITNLTVDNVAIEEVNIGAIRIGGGALSPSTKYEDFDARVPADYDMNNVIIRNIKLRDTLNGAFVPNTTGTSSSLILVKLTNNLTIENIDADFGQSCIVVEESLNTTISNVIVRNTTQYGISVIGTDVLTLYNCFLKPKVGASSTYLYLDVIRNLKLIHNTFIYSNQFDVIQISQARRVLKVVGNLCVNDYNSGLAISFAATINGTPYTRSLAVDFQEEHDNVFVSEGGGFDHILALYGINNGSDILVRKSNTFSGSILDTTYRSTYPGYGVNSKFEDTDIITLTTRTNPDSSTSESIYLGNADSVNTGRNMITTSVDILAFKDLKDFIRTYPTDAGCVDRDAILK